MKMSERCRNNSDNPLTSRRTDGGKNSVDKSLCLVNVRILSYEYLELRTYLYVDLQSGMEKYFRIYPCLQSKNKFETLKWRIWINRFFT